MNIKAVGMALLCIGFALFVVAMLVALVFLIVDAIKAGQFIAAGVGATILMIAIGGLLMVIAGVQ